MSALGTASEHVSEEMLVCEDVSLSNEASGFVESFALGRLGDQVVIAIALQFTLISDWGFFND